MKTHRKTAPTILLSALALMAAPPRSAAQAPLAGTLPASAMLNDAATFNGTVNPNGAETVAWFEWGTVLDKGYGNHTEPQSIGAGTTLVPITAPLSNLVQGVSYRCRTVASNSFGVAHGNAQSFWIPRIDFHTPAFLTVEPGTFVDQTTANGPPPEIDAASYHNLALMADRSVLAWGNNIRGQCNVPSGASNVVAIAAGDPPNLALRADGSVVAWGLNNDGQCNIPVSATNVVAIAAGGGNSLVLREDGSLVAWGNNAHNQLDIPANATNIAAIAAGGAHNLVLRKDGSIVAWGSNNEGQCNIPADATNVVSIAASWDRSMALRADGSIITWGYSDYGLGTVPADATNVTAIAAGGYHSLALRADGSVIGWGFNAEGQASIPSEATNVVAIAAGDYHSLALRADGSAIAWGRNTSGQCDIPGTFYASLPIAVHGTVETNILGTYVLDYSTTNFLGAVATASRTVLVATLPATATLPPTDVGSGQATLQGSVNPAASETQAWFEWGTSTSYGNSTPAVNLGNGTNTVPVSSTLNGLAENQGYHYRMAASNDLGTVYGDDESFGIWQLDDINLADSGAGSLREVIADAPAGSAIVLTNTGTLVLTSGELLIEKDLTITGPGADQLAISGNNASRVLNIAAGCTVEISSLTIRDGRGAPGAYGSYPGTSGSSGASGGGIYNAGTLTLNECAVVNNQAGRGGSGHSGYYSSNISGGNGGAGGNGGGIYNHSTGTLVLKRCTLSGNSSGLGGSGGYGGTGDVSWPGWGNTGGPGGIGGNGGCGGAIHNAGILTVDHCTLSGNHNATGGNGGRGGDGGDGALYHGDGGDGGDGGPGGSGGGIWNAGTLSVASGTIAYNATSLGGTGGAGGYGGSYGHGTTGTVGDNGTTGGINNSATAGCVNTIVASNTNPFSPDDIGGTFASMGYNLIGTTNGAFGFTSASNDLLNMEAQLDPLADNGGPTLTHWPRATSPAIHAGSTNNLPATDQRGFPRVFNGRADIGAVELQVWWPIVTTRPASNAVLHSDVNPKGSHTFTWFEYGLAPAYGAGTEMAQIAGDPDAVHGIQSTPANLLPWMTYHYRAVASNRIGRVNGADLTFTLPGPTVTPPSLSVIDDLLLPQGGSTSVWFLAEPAGVEVRAVCNNPILLPESGLALGGSSLGITPDPSHSGSAQITVTASDGMQSASQTFTLTVAPVDPSQLLGMTPGTVSNGFLHLRIYDAGTASTNYSVEYRPDLSPTSTWNTATDLFDLGGGEYEVDTATGDAGFYRIKGFRLLQGGLASAETEVEEGLDAAGAVVEFNSIFTGTLGYTWTDEQGTGYAGSAAVNGTTVVIPLPAAFLADDSGIGQTVHLTLELDAGAGYVQDGNTESMVTIEENDANWEGGIETDIGMLAFTLTILEDNGSPSGWIQSEDFGFFPTNVLVQLALAENTFTAVATNIPLPVFAGTAAGFTNQLDLRLDAADAPGETNISPDRIEGEATLAVKVPGQPYLDAVQTGPFILTRPPTADSTNEVPLHPVP